MTLITRMKAPELRKWASSLPLEACADACAALREDSRACARVALGLIEKRMAKANAEVLRLQRMYRFESEAWDQGFSRVAGVDEAGRGPLAGPVVAAAVVLEPGCYIHGLNDSKQVPAGRREELYCIINRRARAVATGVRDAQYIDKHNIAQAAFQAMRDALEALALDPEYVLVDGFKLPGLLCPQRAIVKGDALSNSIAAASIVAKVTRDRLMDELHEQYPAYGFDHNRGYATREHLIALDRYGPCPEHRRTFLAVAGDQLVFDISQTSSSVI